MNSPENIQARLFKLEKQNRSFKQFGLAALILPALLLVMGQAPSKKIVEANEFVLRDDGGNVRAKLSMIAPVGSSPGYPSSPQLALFDEKGKQRVQLDGSSFVPGLSLNDSQGRRRADFVVVVDAGLLVLSDEHGNLKTRLKEGEVVATDNVNTSQVRVDDAEGFAATLGVTDLVTPRTGETHKTSAASLVLFDKNNTVIWRAP